MITPGLPDRAVCCKGSELAHECGFCPRRAGSSAACATSREHVLRGMSDGSIAAARARSLSAEEAVPAAQMGMFTSLGAWHHGGVTGDEDVVLKAVDGETVTEAASETRSLDVRASGEAGASSGERGDSIAPEARRLGRYLVIEELGRGGMGLVVRAYDPKLGREVALKCIRGDVFSADAQARLVREAHAMAQLNHPNVVSLYDLDLDREPVVLAMEYVAGPNLRQWLEGDHSWRETLELFVQAGRGLAEAHRVGLLHRDFKPANVLVNQQGIAKVTDFGLARLDDALELFESDTELSEETPHRSSIAEPLTAHGTTMGTPAYMAPEQHRCSSLTAACDQYAFCASLWHGLTGERPFSPEKGERSIAAIKLRGAPPWPRRAAHVPKRIIEAIERGLQPEPDGRWPSMDELLRALSWDPSRRRNQWLTAAAAITVVGVGVGGWRAWGAARLARCGGAEAQLSSIWNDERREVVRTRMTETNALFAERVSQNSLEHLDAYAQQWVHMHTEACEATTIRQEQSARVMDLRMGCLHRAKVAMAAVVEVLEDADIESVTNAHEVVSALSPLPRCADVAALQAAVEPPLSEEAAVVDDARAWLAEARALRGAGRYSEAFDKVQDANAIVSDAEYLPVRAEVGLLEGVVLDDLGRYDQAEEALRRALALAARAERWEEQQEAAASLMWVVGHRRKAVAEAMRYRELAEAAIGRDRVREAHYRDRLAVLEYTQGEYAEAEKQSRLAVELLVEERGPDDLKVSSLRNNLGLMLHSQGRYAEAEKEHRKALAIRRGVLGPHHPELAASLGNLALALQAQGRLSDAEQEHRRAVELRERVLGPRHPETANNRNNLASVLFAQGKLEAAEKEHRLTLEARLTAYGEEHPDVATSRNNLALILAARGRYAQAEREHRRALSIRRAVLGPEHPEVAQSHDNLAVALFEQGRFGEAEAEHRRGLMIRERALGPGHPLVANSRSNLGLALVELQRYAEARTEFQTALAIREEALPSEHPDIAGVRINLAKLLLEMEDADAALEQAELAWERCRRDDVPKLLRAESAFTPAQALWGAKTERNAEDRALDLAREALNVYRTASPVHSSDVTRVERWLSARRGDRGGVGR